MTAAPSDAEKLGDLLRAEPVALAVGSVVHSLVPAWRSGGPCRTLLVSALGEGLDLDAVQGAVSDAAAGGQVALGDELGDVADMTAQDAGCF